jgi:hypothetical protein
MIILAEQVVNESFFERKKAMVDEILEKWQIPAGEQKELAQESNALVDELLPRLEGRRCEVCILAALKLAVLLSCQWLEFELGNERRSKALLKTWEALEAEVMRWPTKEESGGWVCK